MKLFNIKISSFFILTLIAGLILRIIVMFWSFNFRENTDILRWRDWARISYLYSFADTYKTDFITFGTYPNNMPPGTLYNVTTMYQVNLQISKVILKLTHAKEGSLQWINYQLLDSLLRLPSILADLLLGFLIYTFVKSKSKEKYALIASSIFLYNPIIIYNSAFWGQMDSINNLFFYACLYALLKNKYFFSLVFYFLSLYIKLSLLPFLPILFLILYLYQKRNRIKLILSTLASLIIILLITIPISLNPLSWLINFFSKNSLSEMKNITAFAFNFWWLIFNPWISIGKPTSLFNFSEIRLIGSPLDANTFFHTPLNVIGYSLFLLSILPFLYKIIKSNTVIKNESLILLIFSNCALLSFLFLPNMHERYMYPLFPLLATCIGLKRKFIWFFVGLTILNFINLYIVWHPMMIPILSYDIIGNQTFQWAISFLTVATSLFFYLKSIKIIYAKQQES